MRIMCFLAALLIFAAGQGSDQFSDERKREFIDLLRTLPRKGEFYTDAAVVKAGPYLPVLFSLTEKDIEKIDIYPFAAISRGLCDHFEYRKYAVRNFGRIQHPELKLFWGALLFELHTVSREIKRFLHDALASKKQSKVLSEMLGPEFDSFKKRVLSN